MTDIYFKYKTRIEPEKGCLLISEPYLPDPNFQRTVILLCEYNEEGAFGFVLNRPSEVTLDEIIEINSSFKEQVFVGLISCLLAIDCLIKQAIVCDISSIVQCIGIWYEY